MVFPSSLFPPTHLAHPAQTHTATPAHHAPFDDARAAATVPAQSPSDVAHWTPGEYLRYAQEFAWEDADKDGFITGQQGLQLLSQSGLPKDDLRVIWSLADSDRKVTRTSPGS